MKNHQQHLTSRLRATGPTAGVTIAATRTNDTITGTVHDGDGAARQAYEDFFARYDRIGVPGCDDVQTTLDGAVLTPGVCGFDAAATRTGTGGVDCDGDDCASGEQSSQGVGIGSEDGDPGDSSLGDASRSNDGEGGVAGGPGREGGHGR